ncbi:MAG TPA: ABC transporter ATP-binding protein [Gaiellaceae bacterium]|nr:ABC transporter ATP-binding protein [Gaiellaceae bacterium]
MLRVDELSVRYRGVPAVRDVSLTVAEGEIVSVVGPNGAGKTSTLNAIFGLVRASSGSIDFDGTSLLGLAPERIVRHGLALVPEGRHIFSSLTVAENLRLGAITRGRPSQQELDEVLDRFEVLHRLHDAPAGNLSGGEQQQLAIARALLSKPRLLLLDEPSLGLAPLVVDRVFEVLAELREQGVTVLLVEQNASRAVELADRSYVLRSGSVAASGPRDELVATVDFAEAYLGA